MTGASAGQNAALKVNGAGSQITMGPALGSPAALIMIVRKSGLLSVLVQRGIARLVDVVAESRAPK